MPIVADYCLVLALKDLMCGQIIQPNKYFEEIAGLRSRTTGAELQLRRAFIEVNRSESDSIVSD